jgi:hypothetical protein
VGLQDRLAALDRRDRATVKWLLDSDEPAVRRLTLTHVLGLDGGVPEVLAAQKAIFDGPRVRGLLAGQQDDGGFGVGAYAKWAGTHWRLLALAELGVPPDDRIRAAIEHELAWIGSPARLRRATPLTGRVRWCASQEGAALAACVWFGMAADERVSQLAHLLAEWQWPDGGWNCDVRPEAVHSSFNESLKPVWGLGAYAAATGDRLVGTAAERAAEFFLAHRLFRSHRTGEPQVKLLKPHFPTYWHYDFLDGLLALARIGRLSDGRTSDAIGELEGRRRPDGRWRAGGRWWRAPGSSGSNVEVVDWGSSGPNQFVTLNALRVLSAAGRLRASVALHR